MLFTLLMPITVTQAITMSLREGCEDVVVWS